MFFLWFVDFLQFFVYCRLILLFFRFFVVSFFLVFFFVGLAGKQAYRLAG